MSSTFESMLAASRERENELRLIHILIDRLEPDPDQPRKAMDPAQLSELAGSIRQDGVLHPLLVLPANDQGSYQIIAGERRWRAAMEAGLRRVPAFVLRRDDVGRRRVQLVENLQRVDLTATERAQHVALMRELVALQARAEGRDLGERALDERVAVMLGISDRAVRDFLAAVALPAEVQDIARERHLSIKHLKAATMVGRDQAPSFVAATAAAGVTGDEALAAARLVRDEAMPVAQALAEVHLPDVPPVAAAAPAAMGAPPTDASDGADAPAQEEPFAAGTSAASDGAPAIPRRRRAPYVRLLEVERMLARLPLAEATEPAEVGLWIDALDAVIARATALRTSLGQLRGDASPAPRPPGPKARRYGQEHPEHSSVTHSRPTRAQ